MPQTICRIIKFTLWQRYIGLCGPIDEEIGVPELVKEKSLCAHQDYVYFNMPTEEEKQEITAFRSKAQECMERLSRIRPPYNRENLEHINEEMLAMASQRDILRGRWNAALCRSTEPVLKEETSVPAARIQKNVFFYQSLAWVIAGVLLSVTLTVLTLHTRTVPKGMVLALRLLPLLLILIGYGRRLIWLFTPGRQLEALGRGVLSALYQTEQVQSERLLLRARNLWQKKRGCHDICTKHQQPAG